MTDQEVARHLDALPEPYAVMAAGIPGSGKTTEMSQVAERHGVARICPDDIREELSGSAADQSVNAEAWGEAYRRARQALEAGRSVLMDATHAEAWRRPEAVAFYRACGAAAVAAVVFETTPETAKQRNAARDRVVPDHVMDRMHAALKQEPPTSEEGFDAVITVDTGDEA